MKPCANLAAVTPEPSDLDVAIRVAQQLLDSDQVLSLREALRLLLRALDVEDNFSGSRKVAADLRCPAAHPEDPADENPQATTSTLVADLPPAVSDLLAAVVEALTVPLPTIDEHDERAYNRLLVRRTSEVRIILASILDYPNVPIDNDPADLRARTATMPVTYALYEPEADGGQQ
ncbi:hypothetical protein QBA54_31870 [Streptomyces sp. B21-108]|uniref:hypothetical protein n=1 Tax=Streptomyces sp. B21-108 TaxID=3039419 RepID=UPI002FEE69AB